MGPLRRRMIEDMQIRNLTLKTQRVYAEPEQRTRRPMPIDPLHRGGDLAACDLAGTPAQGIQPREMAASIA